MRAGTTHIDVDVGRDSRVIKTSKGAIGVADLS